MTSPTRPRVAVRSALLKLLERAAGCALAGGMLWWIVAHAGPRDATVIVHVGEPDVEVSVDDRTYAVGDLGDSPLELVLRAGRHTLRMSRGGRVLDEQSFDLQGGRDLILATWAPREDAGVEAGAIASRRRGRPSALGPVRHAAAGGGARRGR
jgi:hypothetical protein